MRTVALILMIVSGIFLESKALAQKAVLIEDAETAGLAVEDAAVKAGKKIESKLERRGSFVREKKAFGEIFSDSYGSTYAMRSDRRVGIGLELAGKLGMFGMNAELNFSLDDSALIGFGGGPQYSSFEMGWRHVFDGKSLAPFVGIAYSRWYNSSSTGGSVNDSTPNFLAQKFLTDYEKQSGKFTVNIFAPSAGIQYNMLSGQYVGTSIYAELMMLMSASNFQNVLTGAFGATYYF